MLKFCYRYAKTTHHCSSLLTSPSPSHKQKKLSSGTQNLRFNLLTACIHAETFLLYSLNMGHVIWKYSWTLSSNAKYVFFPPLLILESFVVVYFWFFDLQPLLPRQLMSVTAIRQTEQGWNSLEDLQDGILQTETLPPPEFSLGNISRLHSNQ